MAFDNREFVLKKINDYRQSRKLAPLALHEEHSGACKAHAQHLLERSRKEGRLVIENSPEHLRPGWKENATGLEGEGDTKMALHELLWQNLLSPAQLRNIKEAKTHLAVHVAVDPETKRVFLVARFK